MGSLTVEELHNHILTDSSITGTAPTKLVIIVVPHKDICPHGNT